MYTCFTRYLSFALGPILGTNSFSKTSSRTISARARPSIVFCKEIPKYKSEKFKSKQKKNRQVSCNMVEKLWVGTSGFLFSFFFLI